MIADLERLDVNSVDSFRLRLNELDLSPIMFKLVDKEEGKGWDAEKTRHVGAAYKVFLLLSKMYPNKSVVPTKDIDAFWHYHILDTQLYAAHCEFLFGQVLDHFPYFGMRSVADRADLDAAFEETKLLYEMHGGLVEEYAATCGNGCGSSLCQNNACDSEDCGSSRTEAFLTPERVLLARQRIADLMAVRPSFQD